MEGFEYLLILMLAAWIGGKIFRLFSLPILFGELLAGIIVGPLVFNVIDPNSEMILSLAQLGIFFLMLHAGLETNPNKLLKASKKSILIAIGGILLPFMGGFFASQLFGLSLKQSLFIALALSATAIIISYRIFKDFKLQNTKLATTVLGAAVLSDIIVLIIFSVLLETLKNGSFDLIHFLLTILKTVIFFGVVIIGGFKLQKYGNKFLKNKGFTFTLIMAIFLGLVAESIGLHLVIGAFLAGLFVHEEIVDPKVYKKIEDRIYGLSYSFLGPIFFATLAFHLDFSGFIKKPLFFIALLLIAVFGKLIGAGGAALLQKIPPKKSLIIGIAMNSRGAVDLIIMSIGLQYALINEEVFSILVGIVFATTILSVIAIKPLKGYISTKNS